MPKYTIADYAERIGTSRTHIYNLEKDGKIDFTIKGKKKFVDSDQVDPIVKYKPAHRDVSLHSQKNGAKRKGKDLGPEAGSDQGEKIKFDKNTERVELERALLYEKAKKVRIENEGKLKTLVDFNKTVDTVFNFLRPLRVENVGRLSNSDNIAQASRTMRLRAISG